MVQGALQTHMEVQGRKQVEAWLRETTHLQSDPK